MDKLTKGEVGELLVSNFVDKSLSKIFSFPSPKTKNNVEVADVLIWLNRTVFLIEVKTRDNSLSTASIESWSHSKIKDASKQISNNAKRIKANEQIFLKNEYYQAQLDCESVSQIVGLIILVYEEENSNVNPSKYSPDIYSNEIPIHVISWKDLEVMIEEIKTVPDLNYYLQDRFHYLKISDIPLDQELNVLSYYKTKENNFPTFTTDFSGSSFYQNYQDIMKEKIKIRNIHNENSVWIEKIEELFLSQRKLMVGIPLGLLFAWELGVLSERERAYYGEKISEVQQWFINGNTERYFSYQSQNTGNWLLFHFTQLDEKRGYKSLEQLTKQKAIKEIELNSFEYGIYSIGFRVSDVHPYPIIGSNGAIVMSMDAVEGKYSSKDIEEAYEKHGKKTSVPIKIEEFPTKS
ncbi:MULTISPECIES: nuclease-related domain-containing protein [Colwellia]|uniref:NERD domain-containing protein n=1 Tax=Colwellia marinimaniae TaxID=1513592 RepID=A0ABQ0N0A7_9GAMM|nr:MULTISPECIES: nuclease-related domain-containing protein [Colwellia]GAW97989.1 hypothetical protein MTCD1_03647 [Colwellia marinimaniae]